MPMASRVSYPPIIDDLTERLSESESRSTEPREAVSDSVYDPAIAGLTYTLAERGTQPHRPPRAETGIVPAVSLSSEGVNADERQDATRTTAETRPVTMEASQPAVEQTITALIIEDTPELAEVLEATLRGMKMNVIAASRGNTGVNRYIERNPDLVLLDIHLPDMTGWKALETIKEHSRESGAKLPIIIVITAYGDPANRLVGKLQGVHSYLVKPLSPNEIEDVVTTALSAAR
jgi:CheY-like chemotaxis protein